VIKVLKGLLVLKASRVPKVSKALLVLKASKDLRDQKD
jgi:hypothetical protein